MPPSFETLRTHLNTPECESFMKALATCNSENKFMRFIGTCDTHSTSLNKCILEQKEQQRLRARQKKITRTRHD